MPEHGDPYPEDGGPVDLHTISLRTVSKSSRRCARALNGEFCKAGIVLTSEIEENRLAEFETALRDATRGRAAVSSKKD